MAAFRPLQPASAEYTTSRQHFRGLTTASKPKRRLTLGACVACRERKTKCNGNRPVCKGCEQRETYCLYELGVGERPSDARKRKNEQLQSELLGLRHLYNSLRSCPEHEALDILRRIRLSSSDTPVSECISGLCSPVTQIHPSKARLARPFPSTQEARPSQITDLSSFYFAEEPSRDSCPYLPPSVGLLKGRMERQYGSGPNPDGPSR